MNLGGGVKECAQSAFLSDDFKCFQVFFLSMRFYSDLLCFIYYFLSLGVPFLI